jgi:CRP/FNR family cyclic AMP-dependent transcriptional regulator
MIDITKIDLFSRLDPKILKKLSDACLMRPFTKNETIVRQGEMGLGLYLIAKGHVKVENEKGGQRKHLKDLGPGEVIGEMSLLDNKPRSATVTATEDTECVLLTRDSIMKLMNKYPEIPIGMARVLAERVRQANEEVVSSAASAPAPDGTITAPAPTAATAPAAAPAAAAPIVTSTEKIAVVPVAPAADGLKTKIHTKLLETFQSLYTIKALSRFSVAVLGCPVEGTAPNTIDQIRIGDVKALFFPANEPVDMKIAALTPGCFTLDVFTPSRATPDRFGPVAVDPSDSVRMTLRSGEVRLYLNKGMIF